MSGGQDRLADFPGFTDSMRIEKFFLIVEEFLSSRVQSAKFWGFLLGHLALMIHLVQLALRAWWDFLDEDALVLWDDPS